jgi:hypothetical protein
MDTDLAAAISREHFWSSIEQLAFAGVVIALAIEFAALKFAAPYKKQIDDARVKEIAQANRATEELRQKNLELEKAVSPRILEAAQPAKVLAAFAGMKVAIVSVPDFETRRFSGYIATMLGMFAHWEVSMLPPQEDDISDGIEIEDVSGDRQIGTPEHPQTEHNFNARLVQATDALAAELTKQGIEVNVRHIFPNTGRHKRRTIPDDTILVKVGMKPTGYFLEQRYPRLKAIRERLEQIKPRTDEKPQ